jgi:sugar lactone lactonase YvrE
MISLSCGRSTVKHQATSAAVDTTAATDTVASAFASPENLIYDSATDAILITNINGDPSQKDANGFVSRVSGDLKQVQTKWIDGSNTKTRLDAPKGILLRGDTVYVADVGVVRLFDKRTGAAIKQLPVSGLGLNDLAFDDQGALYVTDTGPPRTPTVKPDTAQDIDAVFRFDGAQARPLVQGTQLERPDGIVYDGASLVVAPLGGNTLYRVDGRGKRIDYIPLGNGQLDGLFRLADGRLLVTSWEGKCVYLLAGTSVKTLLSGIDSPAGVGVDTRRQRVLVTSFNGNRLYAVRLPGKEQP